MPPVVSPDAEPYCKSGAGDEVQEATDAVRRGRGREPRDSGRHPQVGSVHRCVRKKLQYAVAMREVLHRP